MNAKFLKTTLAALVCLTCLGCFCVEPDILPADKAERLKAVPEGTWATYSEKDERQEDMIMGWSDEHNCYTALGMDEQVEETVLVRFYHLATAPYYAMLMEPTNPAEEDKDCPAALFLIKVQEGQMEFLLPLGMSDEEHEALAASSGVDMVEEKLVGSPEAVLAYLDGLANSQGLEVLQRYSFPAPPWPPESEATEPEATEPEGGEAAPEGATPKRAGQNQ